jgi:uncharacterized membrane protein
MDNAIVLFLLRAIHIVGGILWVGGVVVISLFLTPAVQVLGPAAQPVMQFIMGKRKLPVYLMSLGILTTLAGILLMMRNVSLTGGAWARSPMGIGISIGASAAILALIVGMTVSAPAAKRLGPPKPGAAPLSDQERAALMRRLSLGGKATLILLCIAALFMATARYF